MASSPTGSPTTSVSTRTLDFHATSINRFPPADYKDYNMIMSAIKEYHDLTCVKWVRWSGEEDYVYFVPSKTGCWSSVGRVGGMQVSSQKSNGFFFRVFAFLMKKIPFSGIEFAIARVLD